MEIHKAVLGEQHPDYAISLSALAHPSAKQSCG